MSTTPSPPHRYPALWTCLGAFVALLVDQSTKIYAEAFHLLAPPVPTMADHRASSELLFAFGSLPRGLHAATADGSFLSVEVTHVANAGVMLGALEEAPRPVPLVAFLLTTVLALVLAGGLLRVSKPSQGWLRLGAVLLAVGVVGNLVDRLRLGYVVDWVYMQWKVIGWAVDAPAFNIADLLIIGGACLAAGALVQGRWATTPGRTPAPGKPA
jgi:signal peptidase II